MSAVLEFSFQKMEGCGNDYLYVDLAGLPPPDAELLRQRAPEVARAMSDRHFGVGADGLVLVDREDGADVRMHMFNADGSRGEMCGNALRCVAKYVGDRLRPEAETVIIGTDVGPRRARLFRDAGEVTAASVAMAAPVFAAAAIPFRPDLARVRAEGGEGPWQIEVTLDDVRWEASVLSMGNPHCVVFSNHEIDDLDLGRLGRPLATAPMFPAGANVEFIRLAPDGSLRQRTWERGSGETLACGSGACAAAVAAAARGLVPRAGAVAVRLPGGELTIRWGADGIVHMAGPARLVFTGCYRIRR